MAMAIERDRSVWYRTLSAEQGRRLSLSQLRKVRERVFAKVEGEDCVWDASD